MKSLKVKRRVLIVGEGLETEYNYFVDFRNAYADELEATATSIKVVRGKGGSARNIVENAINQTRLFQPNRSRGDRVFLLLDSEGPGRAPELPQAEKLAHGKQIHIVYSCPSIEYWFLCHFDSATRSYLKNCDMTIDELNKQWSTISKVGYNKSDEELFTKLADRLELAREQALAIDIHNIKTHGKSVCINPSTQLYELIAFLIGVRSTKRCPTGGVWTSIQNENTKIELDKGIRMPVFEGQEIVWKM